MASLSLLPPEIIIDICSFLNAKDVATLSATSTEFYQLLSGEQEESSHLWRNLCEKEFTNTSQTGPKITKWKQVYFDRMRQLKQWLRQFDSLSVFNPLNYITVWYWIFVSSVSLLSPQHMYTNSNRLLQVRNAKLRAIHVAEVLINALIFLPVMLTMWRIPAETIDLNALLFRESEAPVVIEYKFLLITLLVVLYLFTCVLSRINVRALNPISIVFCIVTFAVTNYSVIQSRDTILEILCLIPLSICCGISLCVLPLFHNHQIREQLPPEIVVRQRFASVAGIVVLIAYVFGIAGPKVWGDIIALAIFIVVALIIAWIGGGNANFRLGPDSSNFGTLAIVIIVGALSAVITGITSELIHKRLVLESGRSSSSSNSSSNENQSRNPSSNRRPRRSLANSNIAAAQRMMSTERDQQQVASVQRRTCGIGVVLILSYCLIAYRFYLGMTFSYKSLVALMKYSPYTQWLVDIIPEDLD